MYAFTYERPGTQAEALALIQAAGQSLAPGLDSITALRRSRSMGTLMTR